MRDKNRISNRGIAGTDRFQWVVNIEHGDVVPCSTEGYRTGKAAYGCANDDEVNG